MKRLMAASALALAVSLGAPAYADQFVQNGDFTNLTNGVGQLGFNTNAVGWFVQPVSPGGPTYEFVMANGTAGSNGQFGNVSLWTLSNGGSNTWTGLAAGPGNFVALDGAFQNGSLNQTINGLTPGQSYHLTFNYAFSQQFGFDGDTNQDLMVSLGGFSATPASITLASHTFNGWNSASYDITATAATETLSFLSHASPQLPPFALVSNVSLTGGAPEPAAWALMLLGFGGLGLAARLRSRRVAA